MDVGAWLRALGLGQYETTFRESEIDAEVLPDLTEGDLNQLGVPLGHRKRLLKAIAALGTTEATAKPPNPAPASSPAAAERRPITVVFCDLVGSTSMAAKLDAEDWRTLVNVYLDEASAAVTGLGGHVLKKLGDGLMALFGYVEENLAATNVALSPDEIAYISSVFAPERIVGQRYAPIHAVRVANKKSSRQGLRAFGGRRDERDVHHRDPQGPLHVETGPGDLALTSARLGGCGRYDPGRQWGLLAVARQSHEN